MIATIEPGRVSGTIVAPPSKSLTQRALAAALLHRGTTHIYNAGYAADEQAALRIIQQLGAVCTETKVGDQLRNITVVSSGVHPIADSIHCGESGLAARLFTPLAALGSKPVTVSGAGSLLSRPISGLADILPALGVTLTDFNGFLPYTVCGPLQAAPAVMNASGSSQLLSGVLFALAAGAHTSVTLEVTGLESKPYIDLTQHILAHFGMPFTHTDYKQFTIDPSVFKHTDPVEIAIEGDWSSASCLLVAGAIAGEMTVSNLNTASLQADRAILDVLQMAGANIGIAGNTVTAGRSSLKAFEFDASDSPDLFPALAVLAAFCRGESRIAGVHRLFHKESNRVESIAELLWSFGISFSVEEDALCVVGGERLNGTVIDAYNDHRIVMAAAICALRARSRTDIPGAEAVNKSFPGFFDAINSCGVRCALS